MPRLILPTLASLLVACGPAVPRPPATQPAVGPRPPATQAASQPTPRPVPWVTERCRGPLPGVAWTPTTQPAATPLAAAEVAELQERGLLLEPARLRHLVVARGGHLELHRKATPNGNGKGRNGVKKAAADGAPRPGVVCAPIAEADLLPLPGCERVHLCHEPGAYALVVESGGRPVMARGAMMNLGNFAVQVARAPEAGEQLVWQVTERGLDPAHMIEREVVLRPQGLRLRQVFGRVVASTIHEPGTAGVRAYGPASRPAECVVEPLAIRCGDDRYAWDADAFEYRLAVPAGLVPYKPQEIATGAIDPVRGLYAALHAAAAASVALQRRGFECVEAQTSYELWSRWPIREGRARGPREVWRVSVGPGRVAVEILPYVAEDDGLPKVRGVKPDHDYRRERAFLAALKEALARKVDAPPKGLEGFRCGAGFGQPIADVSLGAAPEKVRTREQRWRRKCDKTPQQVKKAATAVGGKVRFTCERDGVSRSYDFAAGALVTVTERYPSEFAPRHLRRATERWIARFGDPTAATDAVSRWRWHDRELSATRLPDGAALFEHRMVPPPASQPAAPRAAQACRSKTECPYSQACVGGRCGPCRDHRDCRADSVCRGGRCVQGPL